MEEEKRQTRILIAIALVFCALLIGYNAFYVPDASLESFVETDVSADGVDESQAESPGKINLSWIRCLELARRLRNAFSITGKSTAVSPAWKSSRR